MARNKKYAFLVAYNGRGYHGCQYNGDVITVEKVLIECLSKANMIKECNLDPKKIHLQRCSRTDAGVHASLNVFVAKISNESSELEYFKELLLNNKIYLYKVVRVGKSFSAQRLCDGRVYEYFIPTFVFENSEYEKDLKNYIFYLGISDENKIKEILANLNFDKEFVLSRDFLHEKFRQDFEKIKQFRLQNFEKVKSTFKNYEGTHDYSNFTNKSNQKGTMRYMKKVEVYEPFLHKNGVEYIKVEFNGQSFLYNQIRKMVGYAVEYIRYSKTNFSEGFEKKPHRIFTAPSQYLLLERPLFEFYNKSPKRTHGEIEIDYNEIVKVKNLLIYNDIFENDNIQFFLKWLSYTSKFTILP